MKYLVLVLAAPVCLAPICLAPICLATERPPAVRGLLGNADAVVRGTVVGSEPSESGSWNRVSLDGVIWEKSDRAGPRPMPASLRVFAHRAEVCEAAALGLGHSYVLGIALLPSAGAAGVHPFLARLRQEAGPDIAGEAAAIAAPDGVVCADADPAAAEGAARLVLGVRDPSMTAAERRGLLLELAAHPDPAVRAESIRRLGMTDSGLAGDPGAAAQELALFVAEIDGAAHPRVLEAHLETIAAARPAGTGEAISRLLARVAEEDIADRAEETLAAAGSPEELRSIAAGFPRADPAVQARILRALSLRGDEENLTAFASALKSPEPSVRLAAVAGLRMHRAAAAGGLLASARADPDPGVRLAAASALERRARSFSWPDPPAVNPGRARMILEAARKRAGNR